MTKAKNGTTGRAERPRTLEEQLEELELLFAIGREMTALAEPEDLLPRMVARIAETLQVEIVSVMLVEEEDGRPVLRIRGASGLPQEVVERARVLLGEGISGWVAERGEPVLILDVAGDTRFRPSPFQDQYRTGSLVCVPLLAKGRVIGVVNLNNKRSGAPFDDHDLRFIRTLAGQAALALENGRLYAELRDHDRRLERIVAEKTAEHKQVFENIGSGILTLSNHGEIRSINPAGAEIFGRPPEEVVGRYLGEFVGEEANRAIVETALLGREERRREMTLKRPDGREIPVGFSTFPIEGEDRRPKGQIILFRDLTEINQLNEAVRRMDRLASLGIMAAGIAHELKNPLTPIKFGLEFLRESVPPEAQEELGIIGKHIDRVNEIVNSLLRISRPQKTRFDHHDLNRIVRNTTLLVKKQSRGIEIREEMDPSLPPVFVDENQIQQVILNIALNAIQAMGDSGVLTVRTFAAARGGASRAVVEVSDTGPGIPPENLEYIFHPFYTTRDGGTGLGLSVSYRIMQDHRGDVTARNNPEGGATFRLELPADGGGPPDGAPGPV